ncbi:ABC transporter substrate-binding protein [Nocardioides sp. LHG3406-4]|uniref:ABC transporter substrate-binding protein n=1 Tax=Nocardioides sp. LHG3406-4 TaxID=2804575 RepID=UPI003CF4EB36
MKRFFGSLAAVSVAALLASCGSNGSGDGSDGADELTIGGIHAMTGDLGSYGPPMTRGMELAAQAVNDEVADIDGAMTVGIETADSESKAEGAVAAARKVVGAGASCLIGPITTPESVAVLNAVTKARKMTMVPEASAAALREVDDAGTITRIIPPDQLQGGALAQVVHDTLGGAEGKKVAFAFQNSSYGIGLEESFTKAWEELGGEVSLSVGYSATQPGFESEAQQLTEDDMDAIVVADYPETFGKLADALLRTGKYDPNKLFVSDALNVSPIPDSISPEALEGARGTQGGVVTDTPQAKAFDELATAEGERGPFDAQVFDASMLCYLAAVAADSTDPGDITAKVRDVANAPGKEYSYLDLPEAIKALQAGEDIDYAGASGPIQIGEDGDTEIALYEQFRFIDGKLTVENQITVE